MGPSDLYVKSESDINLICILPRGPHDLGSVFWYKGMLRSVVGLNWNSPQLRSTTMIIQHNGNVPFPCTSYPIPASGCEVKGTGSLWILYNFFSSLVDRPRRRCHVSHLQNRQRYYPSHPGGWQRFGFQWQLPTLGGKRLDKWTYITVSLLFVNLVC